MEDIENMEGMKDYTEEEKEKIKFVKQNIIEKGIDPNSVIDYLKSKNPKGQVNLKDFSLKEFNQIINIVTPSNIIKNKIKEGTNPDLNLNKNEIKSKNKKILKKEKDERFGVIIPEFIDCKKNETSLLSNYDQIEVKIDDCKKVENTFFGKSYYIFDVKTNPLNLYVKRK